MARQHRNVRQHARQPKTTTALPVIRPDAAGIDVGANELYVAVPQDRDPQPVRAFATFTQDLHALADWLQACGIRTVAMEATGVYWIPIFQILEARGLEVLLVNARAVKNVAGRKSDVSDCQWLQYLHAVGLLRGSFRPPGEVCVVRSLLRHRDTLVSYAAAHVQHMQKALTQMNVQLHHVLADLTGKSGLAILDAILKGERDPQQLAKLRDPRVKASEATVAKALQGDWRTEHLFTLRQALAAYRHYQQLIAECDAEIMRLLQEMAAAPEEAAPPRPADPEPEQHAAEAVAAPKGKRRGRAEDPLQIELRRVLGIDLTAVPGLGVLNVHALFAELGRDLHAFPTSKHFASWLGLCPDNRVSGGKVLSTRTRDVRSRLAQMFRLAAQTLHHNDSHLGAFYRRMRSKLGAPKAITATAHKLARIVYHLLKTHEPYDESIFAVAEARHQERRLRHLRREAALLGFTLAAQPSVS
jgi:transposase